MDPDDASNLSSITATGGLETEPPGAAVPALDPDRVPPSATAGADLEPATEPGTVPLEADEARLLGGVTADAIAVEPDAPPAAAGTQPEPARVGTDAPATSPPPGAGAGTGTDGHGADTSAPPSMPVQLVTAAGSSMVKRAVPVVSIAAIVALIVRSLRRRN